MMVGSLLANNLGLRLLGRLGDLALATIILGDTLDHTDGDRLPHVTHGKPPQRGVVGEGLREQKRVSKDFKTFF